MPVLADLLDALRTGRVEVVDLTAPLHSGTPIIQLPPPFANAAPFALTEISRFDERGPAWYWNDISTGEHTGTHFDAPVHWITGRDGEDVVAGPGRASWSRPAAVLDFSARGRDGPRLPAGGRARPRVGGRARPAARRRLAALPHRLGRPQRRRRRPSSTPNETGPHTPGISRRVRAVAGRGGAGDRARRRDRRHRRRRGALLRPARSRATPTLLGAGKYGLTQLQNLARLPATGAVVLAGPLPIVGGVRQPGAGAGAGRALSDDRRRARRHARWPSSASGTRSASSAAATSTSPTRCAPPGSRSSRPGTRAAPRRWPTPGRARPGGPRSLTVHQGCGLTNAMTGIAEAAKSRTPLLVLAADTAAAAVRSNFRIDQDALVDRRRRGAPSGCTRPPRRPPTSSGPTGRPSSSGARSCSTCRWTCRPRRAAGRARCRAVPRAGARSGRAAVDELAAAARRPRSARCSSPAAARARPAASCGRSAPRPGRCSRPRPSRTGCSPATRGRSASPAGSPRRWPPS